MMIMMLLIEFLWRFLICSYDSAIKENAFETFKLFGWNFMAMRDVFKFYGCDEYFLTLNLMVVKL